MKLSCSPAQLALPVLANQTEEVYPYLPCYWLATPTSTRSLASFFLFLPCL